MKKRRVASWCSAFFLLAISSGHAADLTTRVTDSQGKPLEGAVIYLTSQAAALQVQPLQGARLVQQNKSFVPEVLVVTRGTAVDFPNEDTVRHHVYSFSPVKKFEIKLYVGTPSQPVTFENAGVALLGCNIHDNMVAWVVVVDTPYYAQTNHQGEATITGLPADDYQLNVWHKRMPIESRAFSQAATITSGALTQSVILPSQLLQ